MRQPRALLITDVTGSGGTDTFLVELAQSARNQGWEVGALINETAGSDRLNAQLVESRFDVVRDRLYHGYYAYDVCYDAVVSRIRTFAPQIAHVLCGSPRSAIAARNAIVRSGIPLFFSEMFVPERPNVDSEVQAELIRLYEHAAHVTTVCRDNIRLLADVYGFPSGKISYVPSCISTEHLPEKYPVRARSQPFVEVVAAARFVRQKGLDVLIEAASLLEPDARKKLRLTLMGEGPEEGALRAQVEAHGLLDFVRLVPWQDDLRQALESYDLFISPSRHEGGLPFTVLIAVSKAMPIIASRISGIVEALDDGRAGELVPPEDPVALASAIRAYATDPADFHHRIPFALEHLRRNYDARHHMARIVAMWKDELVRRSV